MRIRAFSIEITVISVIAFVLHFIWERAQCPLFFIHRGSPSTELAMLIATLGDVVLTWVGYITVAALSRNVSWYKSDWNALQKFALTGVAILLGLVIEWSALQSGRWEYTDKNPLIPGTIISVLPILQLVFLFPATFGLASFLIMAMAPKINAR